MQRLFVLIPNGDVEFLLRQQSFYAHARGWFLNNLPAPTVRTLPDGIWEASNGKGGAVGINLWEVSSSLGHGGPPVSDNEALHAVLQIGVYERSGEVVHCGEENFFDTGWQGHKDPGVRSEYTDGLLAVVYPQFPREVAMNVELRWNQRTDVWEGRFHSGGFDHAITLRRAPARPNHDQSLCIGSSVMPRSDVGRMWVS